MSIRMKLYNLCIMLSLVSGVVPRVLYGQPSTDQPSSTDTKQAFVQWCVEHVPDSGSINVVYESPGRATGWHSVGIDAKTRAWHYISGYNVAGRTTKGAIYNATKDGQIQLINRDEDEDNRFGCIAIISNYIPSAFLYYFIDRPEHIISARLNEGNRWEVTFLLPGDMEGTSRQIFFMPDGSIEKTITIHGNSSPVATVYEYTQKDTGGFLVATNVGSKQSKHVVRSIELYGRNPPDFFDDLDKIESIRIDFNKRNQIDMNAKLLHYTKDENGNWQRVSTPSPEPYAGSKTRSLMWPIVGVGVILLGLGGFEIWRRQRA